MREDWDWSPAKEGWYGSTINLVRIPDVSFISWERVPGGEIPKQPVPLLVPDLAVEVLSRGNTPKEMDEKLQEYFEKGVRLVWFVRPRSRVVNVYTAPDHFTRLTASMRLDGGDVLPGFSVQVGELFQIPKRPTAARANRRRTARSPGRRKGRGAAVEKWLDIALPHNLPLESAPIMPTTPARYRLVIFEAIDEPQEVRELVCRVTGMHPTDATQWLARAPGTWPKPLEESEVRKLLDGLFELGIAAEAWRTDLFPELSPRTDLHRAACMTEGFRTEGLRGEPTHWVPWDRIELICAGQIGAEDEYRHVQPPRWPSMVVSGIRALVLMKPQPSSRRARATRIPRDPVGEVIIVRREPADRLPHRREPDELRVPRPSPEPVRRGELPGLPGRPLCPRRRGLPDPVDRARCSRTATRRVRIPQLAGPPRLRHPPLALELVPARSRCPVRLAPGGRRPPPTTMPATKTKMTRAMTIGMFLRACYERHPLLWPASVRPGSRSRGHRPRLQSRIPGNTGSSFITRSRQPRANKVCLISEEDGLYSKESSTCVILAKLPRLS